MRSRYTAYVLENSDYLLRSWHPHTRPTSLHLKTGEVRWTGLTIINIKAGRAGDKKGEVEFIASYEQSGQDGRVQENSHFVFEQGQWFYLDGDLRNEVKAGRNSPCPCGSGKKFKKCCASKL